MCHPDDDLDLRIYSGFFIICRLLHVDEEIMIALFGPWSIIALSMHATQTDCILPGRIDQNYKGLEFLQSESCITSNNGVIRACTVPVSTVWHHSWHRLYPACLSSAYRFFILLKRFRFRMEKDDLFIRQTDGQTAGAPGLSPHHQWTLQTTPGHSSLVDIFQNSIWILSDVGHSRVETASF